MNRYDGNKAIRDVATSTTILKHINENLTATIRTQYGNTRTIKIKDSIRQGGVLSVIEYANLIDEIAKEIQKEKIGTTQIGNQTVGGVPPMDGRCSTNP